MRVQSHIKTKNIIPSKRLQCISSSLCTPYGIVHIQRAQFSKLVFKGTWNKQNDCVCVCAFFRTGDLYCIQSSFAFVKIQFRFFDFRAILFSLHLTFDARICWCQNHLLYEHNTHRERNIHVHSSVSLCVCMSVRGLRTLSHCASHTRMNVTK